MMDVIAVHSHVMPEVNVMFWSVTISPEQSGHEGGTVVVEVVDAALVVLEVDEIDVVGGILVVLEVVEVVVVVVLEVDVVEEDVLLVVGGTVDVEDVEVALVVDGHA